MTTQIPPRFWKDRRLWLALLALALLGAGGVFYTRYQAQQQAALEAEANRPLPPQVQVAALGRVEPAGGVVNVSAAETGIISQLLVKEGDRVTQGQPLAYLNSYDVRLAERDYAESQLVEAQETLTAQTQLGEARVQEADSRIGQIDLPEEEAVRAQEATIGDLEAQLNLAEVDLARYQTLANQGAIAQQQLDSQVAQVERIQQQISAAEATLAQLASARDANIGNASAQRSTAEADLSVSQATAGVQSAQRNLALAEARLAQTVINSPITGQVIEVLVDPGESVEGEAVFALGSTQTMQVVAEVYETDVGKVRVGQKATVRSRNGAFEETLTGTVEEVALQIFKNDVLDDDPAANADARVVEVDIRIDQPDVIRSLTNLQVDVVIDIAS
jgi:HlyD family secretion protein